MPLTIAILTTDKREHEHNYDAPMPSFGTAPEALLQGFAQIGGCNLHVISCTQQPVRPMEKIADNIRYHALHVPKSGWMRTAYQGCIRATRKKLREIQPDIVHGQGTERDCALSAVLSGFPNVLTIHGNMRFMAKIENAKLFSYWRFAAWLEAFSLPRADGIVCITNYTRDAVAELAKRTWVVPNAVDESFFEVQSQINPSGPPAILCVGYICPRKNQNAFIRALDPLAAKQKLRLVFAGEFGHDDPYALEFFELIRARSWCEHIGFINREKLKSHLSRATLLALPSLEDNCPMAVLEAAATNVPVIAARVGGVPDLIEDGKNGLLFDPQNATEILAAAEKMLLQPEWARALAAEANRRACERFHPAVIARRHLEIYREVLNNRA
jgi:glycosyltransferase involved in cell wall biosynthesis